MATGFACPNPTCNHVFPDAAVQGATALKCPHCGSLFQFRPGAASPKAPARAPASVEPPKGGWFAPPAAAQPNVTPSWVPPPSPAPAPTSPQLTMPQGYVPQPGSLQPYPQSPPLQPTPPQAGAMPAAPLPIAEPFVTVTEEPVIAPRPRRGSGFPWVIMFVVLLLGGGAVVGVALYVIKEQSGVATGPRPPASEMVLPKSHESQLFNYSYTFPSAPWKMDNETKQNIQSNLFAIRRTQPDAWLALWAKDYKTYTPRDGELFDEVYGRLLKCFLDLEYEQQSDAQLAGQRAMKLAFQGTSKDQGPVVGEAYLLVYKGIAYAVLTWCRKDAQAEASREFDDLRLRFALMGYRENWVDKRVPMVFHGTKAGYTLRDTQTIWKKNTLLQEAFKAELVLEAIDPNVPDSLTNTATVRVQLQPKKPDLAQAAAFARSELDKEQLKDYPQTKIAVVSIPSGPLDREAPVGDQKGHVAKLHVINGEARQRFVMVAVALAADQTIAFYCECPWDKRSLWERDFDQLIGTFRLTK